MKRSEAECSVPQDVRDKLGDRYCDIKYVSCGATSMVFSAHDSILDKRIALKVLTPSQEQDFIRFQKEAKAASQLDHRNLVKILNFDVTQTNHAYLIMDYVEGEDLENIVNSEGKLSVELALDIALQICDGMEHAHQKQIVHRDLKASNVVISNFAEDQMHVTVVDFGLARIDALDSSGRSTPSGRVQGSPRYMSPEQARGQSGDARCDIYALGCIIFKMVTGDTPFDDEEVIGVLRQHISQAPPRLSDRTNTAIPQELEEIVARLLEKEPQSRYQSMSDVHAALEGIRIAADEPVEPQPEPSRKLTRAMVIRWAALLTAPIVFGLLLLLPHTAQRYVEQVPAPEESTRESALKKFKLKKVEFDEPQKYKNLVTCHENAIVDDEDLQYIGDMVNSGCNGIDLAAFQGVKGEGIKHLRDLKIECINAQRKKLEPIGWRYLAEIKTLQQLDLEGSNIADADLKHFKNHLWIWVLLLADCKGVSDDALKAVATIPHISKLDLSGTKVTDNGLKALSNCPELSRIYLDSTQISDQGLRNLRPCPSLSDLHVTQCSSVTGNGIRFVMKTWPGLAFIELGGKTTIKASDLECLKNAKSLRHLHASGIAITDDSMKVFGSIKNLNELLITKGSYSSDSLKNLHSLRDLRSVTLYGCENIPRESIAELKARVSQNGKHKVEILCPGSGFTQDIPEQFSEIYSKETETIDRDPL